MRALSVGRARPRASEDRVEPWVSLETIGRDARPAADESEWPPTSGRRFPGPPQTPPPGGRRPPANGFESPPSIPGQWGGGDGVGEFQDNGTFLALKVFLAERTQRVVIGLFVKARGLEI